MNKCHIDAFIDTETIDAYTYPSGPRGVGIKSITQDENNIVITYDDGANSVLEFPSWWFGTRADYNKLSPSERAKYYIYFIEEGT